MTNEAFTTILEDRIAAIRKVLASKAEEYASDADRLHNFKAAALLRTTTPAESVMGMLVKHWVSVEDIALRHYSRVPERNPSVALINEKIGDAINYLILLEAVLKETP